MEKRIKELSEQFFANGEERILLYQDENHSVYFEVDKNGKDGPIPFIVDTFNDEDWDVIDIYDPENSDPEDWKDIDKSIKDYIVWNNNLNGIK